MKAKDIQRKRTNSGANGTREFIPYEDLVFLDVKDDLTPEVLGPEFKPQEMQLTRGKKEWGPDEQFNLLYLYFRDIGKEFNGRSYHQVLLLYHRGRRFREHVLWRSTRTWYVRALCSRFC